MNTRFSALVAAIPVAFAGSVAFSGISQAALIDGSQLNVTIDQIQMNLAGLPSTPVFPPGYPSIAPEPDGGADFSADAIFGNLVPPQFVPSAGNRVMDNANCTDLTGGPDCEVGDTGQFRVGASSGSFIPVVGSTGTIKSFDGNSLPIGFTFVTVGDFEFSLAGISTFNYNPFGGNGLEVGTPVPEGFLEFVGTGTLRRISTGETAPATFSFNGTGFRDDGTGGDAVANDGVTNVTTNSGSANITVTPVPEPSTLGFLATAALLGLACKNKATKR